MSIAFDAEFRIRDAGIVAISPRRASGDAAVYRPASHAAAKQFSCRFCRARFEDALTTTPLYALVISI